MQDEILKRLQVLYSAEEIERQEKRVAEQIDKDYNGEEIIAISILKGAVFFSVDLLKNMKTPVILETMQVSSYQGTQSTGNVLIKKDLDMSIENKNVLIIEDIIDTGYTLKFLKEYLLTLKPKSIKIVVLADKKARRKVDIDIDYKCFDVEDQFLVGYGFDVDEKYRNIPYIGYVK